MSVFQFSLWDSPPKARYSSVKARAFNSLYEIRGGLASGHRSRPRYFQFSLWDSKRRAGGIKRVGAAKSFNSLYEILCRAIIRYFTKSMTFNSLYEIHYATWRYLDHLLLFQFSLWDSAMRRKERRFRVRVYFQFSLWDSPARRKRKARKKRKFFQFSLWDSYIVRENGGRSVWGTFNSLYEIPPAPEEWLQKLIEISFNSLYEIHLFQTLSYLVSLFIFQFSLWDSDIHWNPDRGYAWELSILSMRFQIQAFADARVREILAFQFSLWDSFSFIDG